MRIVADENIPLLDAFFSGFGDIHRYPGRTLDRAAVADADILLVRSVTRVTRELLEGTPVRFVGTCTIGTDHLDLDYFHQAGIQWSSAPGCNARGVVDYVLGSLLTLAEIEGVELASRTYGIVGAGQVGGRLIKVLRGLGWNVLVCDPPRQAAEGGDYVSLDEIVARCDVISLHTPLNKTGDLPTWHLFDRTRLQQLKHGAWLINAARGPIVDNSALREVLLEREDLPSEARHMLVSHIADTLLNCGLVRSTLARGRIEYVGREADEAATVAIAGTTSQQEVPALVEHLRASGRLTPSFLIHALCLGKADLVAEAVSTLSGLGERRVRPILATGRLHAVRALFEACGLTREIAAVFVEAVLLWRDASAGRSTADVCGRLIERFSGAAGQHPAVSDMIQMIERRHRLEMRFAARAYASELALAA